MRVYWMLFLWVWWVGAAPAWAFNVEFCVDVDVEYDWTSSGGDRWTGNSVDKAARGFDFIVADGFPGTVFGSGTLATNNADAGCTGTISLSAGNYILLVYPEGTVQGNDFEHLDGTIELFGPFPISADVTYHPTIVGADAAWEQAVAVAYALNLNPGGNSGQSFPIEFTTLGAYYSAGTIYFPDDERDKYLIAHELGHAVTMKRSGGATTPSCGCAGNCDGGDNLRRKGQAQAMTEGLGWWYAAITWNEKGGGDCEWWNVQNLDIDLDGNTDYAINSSLPCWGDPDTTAPDHTDGDDWLSDVLNAGAGMCAGTDVNRSTEYDWVHYGWGLHTYGSDNVADDGDELTPAEIIDLWVQAGPTTWDATGLTTPSDATDDPYGRWDGAATFFGGAYDAAHDHQKGAVDH